MHSSSLKIIKIKPLAPTAIKLSFQVMHYTSVSKTPACKKWEGIIAGKILAILRGIFIILCGI